MKHLKVMTLEEINNELNYLFSERSDRFDFTRIENLLEKKDILKDKGIVFHYSESITPAEIQVAAKILKAILTKNVYMNNVDRLDCPKPNEIKGSWHDIPNALLANESSHFFYIDVSDYGKMRYTLKNNRQIVDISSTLALKSAQDSLKSIKDNTCLDNMKEIDSLTSSFILINSSILSFFLGKDQESSSVSYSKKYNPCFLERERLLHLKGLVSDHTDLINDILKNRIEEQSEDSTGIDLSKELVDLQNKIKVCQRYFLSDFALQVKFLTFWVSLLDVSTFPALPQSYKEVYENLIDYLLENYSNLYVYDIVLETEPVKGSTQTELRGSPSNTTRLKIYYTNYDDVPRIIRLDLPHQGHPYVHVNIENDSSDENNHVRISQDEKQPGEYDHIFDILQDTLKLYNFFSITTKHSPVSDDRMMFKEMKYWIAMYTYAIAAYSYYTIGKSKKIDDCCFEYRQKLIELLKEDGVDENESQKLSPADLFELAHSIIEKNDYIHF